MDDNIFKPLTHLDREGPEGNNDRFQRRDNTNFHTGAFEQMDTSSVTPQEGWNPENENIEQDTPDGRIEANGCMCPSGEGEDTIVVETVVMEFYNDPE